MTYTEDYWKVVRDEQIVVNFNVSHILTAMSLEVEICLGWMYGEQISIGVFGCAAI